MDVKSIEAFQIVLFLIPGLFSSIILNVLIVQKEKNKFNLLVDALIFSLIIYATLAVFNQNNPITIDKINETAFKISYHLIPLILLLAFSLFYSISLSLLINYDIILKMARYIKFTKKDSDSSVWYGVLKRHNEKRPIIIHFVDKKRLSGTISKFSDEPESQYLYVTNAAWVILDKITKQYKYDVIKDTNGVLITPRQEIAFIEFRK